MTIRGLKCEDCGANRGVTIYDDGSICFACGKKQRTKSLVKVDKIEKNLFQGFMWDKHRSEKINQYLTSIGINQEMADFYSIGSKGFDRLVFPYYNDYMCKAVYAKCLRKEIKNGTLSSRKVLSESSEGSERPRHYWLGSKEHLKSYDNQPEQIVIVEDVFSWMRVSKFSPSRCTRGCTPRLIDFDLDEIENTEKIIIWYDNDKAGIEGARKVAKMLAPYQPNIEIINSGNDPKDNSDTEIEEILLES